MRLLANFVTLTLSFCITISCIGFSISVFIYSYRCRESCIYKLAHHEHSDECCTLDFLISSRANLLYIKDIDHVRTPRAPHGACLTVYSHRQLLLFTYPHHFSSPSARPFSRSHSLGSSHVLTTSRSRTCKFDFSK